MQNILDMLSLRRLLLVAIFWLVFFAGLYAVTPCFLANYAELKGAAGCSSKTIPLALYTSIITMFSLGYSDVYPTGMLRVFASVQVIGGVVLAGMSISKLVDMPAGYTRRAIKACTGYWVECIDIKDRKRFYSFTTMMFDGRSMRKDGYNYEPNGSMDNTHYSGELVANLFPTMMSVYENDTLSTDYSGGIFMFEMRMSMDRVYRSYAGGCYDRKFGLRDRILAKRIEDEEFIRKFDSERLTEADMRALIERLFSNHTGSAVGQPTIFGTQITKIEERTE